MKSKVEQGEFTSMSRDRKEIQAAKDSKGGGPSTWFLSGSTEGSSTCPCTPNGVLKKELSKAINRGRESGMIRVIENAGSPVSSGLRKANPFPTNGCTFLDPRCPVDPDLLCQV